MFSNVDSFIWMSLCWQTNKNLQHLYIDTGCSLEDLREAIDDRDEWQKIGRFMLAAWPGDDDDDDDDDEIELLSGYFLTIPQIQD